MQLRFVEAFDTGLAHVRGAGITLGIQRAEVGRIDASDVADHMRKEFALGVVARQVGHDIHAGKSVAFQCEARDLVIGQAQSERQALEAPARRDEVKKALAFVIVEGNHFGQFVECLRQIAGAFGHQFESIGQAVVGKDLAVAIQDQAACRRQGLQLDAVAVGTRGVLAMAQDHQLAKARQQHAKHGEDDPVGEHRAALEQQRFDLLVLDRCGDGAGPWSAAAFALRLTPAQAQTVEQQEQPRPSCHAGHRRQPEQQGRPGEPLIMRIHRSSTRSFSNSANTAPACCQIGKKRRRWRKRSVR